MNFSSPPVLSFANRDVIRRERRTLGEIFSKSKGRSGREARSKFRRDGSSRWITAMDHGDGSSRWIAASRTDQAIHGSRRDEAAILIIMWFTFHRLNSYSSRLPPPSVV